MTSTRNEQKPVLQVTGLAVNLGGREVLQNMKLALGRGEYIGLIGPNGAGKTTLLRAILGLVKTAAGSVTVTGNDKPGKQQIGYVPQRHEFAWDFPITVEDAVMTGRVRAIGWLKRPAVTDYTAVADALERVRMTHLRERPVGELSGGQRQRVLVARALALESTLLLLDEPFAGLDMPTQELLSGLFQELAAEGKAVLMSTHDLGAAFHECSRLILLNRTIIADDAPQNLKTAAPWLRAFKIKPENPLLKTLGVKA